MPRSRSPRGLRLTLLAIVLLVAASVTSAGAAQRPAAADEGCSMPECYAAIAFNPETGFWVKTRNYPTREAARSSARDTCTAQRDRDRHCRVLRVARGPACIGAAMRVEGSEVLAHDTALRSRYKAALQAAEAKLDGPGRQRHRITGVCNG